MTSSNYDQFIIFQNCWVKTSWWRPGSIGWYFDFMPDLFFQIKEPQVIKVCEILSSKNYKIFINNLGNMICSLPGFVLIILWLKFDPLFGSPIKRENRVESFLALSSTSKQNQFIALFIVVQRGIGSGFRNDSSCFVIFPLQCQGAKNPHIVHVIWIYHSLNVTCISAEDYEIVSYDAATMTPSLGGFAWVEGLDFLPS